MTIPSPFLIGIAVFIVVAILVLSYSQRGSVWMLLDLLRPITEGTGRGIEYIFRRPLPPGANYDLLCHIILIIPLALYALVTVITQNQDLMTHLPILLYLYFGTMILSFGIAFALNLR